MFRFRLRSLIIVITAVAILCGVIALRKRALVSQLRHDLEIPAENQVTIIDRAKAHRVIGVIQGKQGYKLFVCYRGSYDGESAWVIPVIVGSGAPPGEPEAIFEYSQELDHFPTELEVSKFRKDYGL